MNVDNKLKQAEKELDNLKLRKNPRQELIEWYKGFIGGLKTSKKLLTSQQEEYKKETLEKIEDMESDFSWYQDGKQHSGLKKSDVLKILEK